MTIKLDLFTIAMLAFFLVVGPLLARREMAALRNALSRGDLGARLRVYRGTMISEWIMTIVLLAAWVLLGRSLDAIGLVPRVAGWQWLAMAVTLIATGAFAINTLRSIGDSDKLADVRAELGVLSLLAPHTPVEERRFTWLSVTAGICEEILYRGLLMTSLATAFGLWPAVVLSSLVFGMGHTYQGAGGVLRTALVGLVMALVVVFTGSLIAAMVMHVVIDITQGRLVAAAIRGGNETPEPHDLAPSCPA